VFLTKDAGADSRGALFLAWALSMIMVPLGRWLTSHILRSRSWWGVPVVIVGAGNTARSVIRNLNKNRILGYRPVACLDDDPRKAGLHEGVPVVGTLVDAGEVAARYGAQYAILAIPDMPRDRLVWNLRRWRRIFPKILLVPNLAGVSSLWMEPRDLGGMLGLEMRQNLLNKWNQRFKRSLDVAASFLGLLALAPLIAICALWIKRVSPGRAFYTQEREGKDGRTIRVLKLRTMFPDAERMLKDYLARNPEAREEWDRFCKLKHDPRIIPVVGHFLRKTSLDELPQLWNVLTGEMSLVGPRPFPAYHNARFDPEFRRLRTQVTPGLTGLWQVSARSDGDLEVQESLDSYYIRNWSLWLDLYILVRTTRAVLAPEGSY
jgi:Undecaprenyl-phosphate galactose phosphotransferase WbaP